MALRDVVIAAVVLTGFSWRVPQAEGATKGEAVLQRTLEAMHDPAGVQCAIRWNYAAAGESWSGDGVLELRGRSHLKLTLPPQIILIQEDKISTLFRDTGQVVIDRFDDSDPSSPFALWTRGIEQFRVATATTGDNGTRVVLSSKAPVGFDTLVVEVGKGALYPRMVEARAGKDIRLTIDVLGVSRHPSPGRLDSESLVGREVIDLRE